MAFTMTCTRSNSFLLVTLLLAHPDWCHAYHPRGGKRPPFRRLQNDKNNDKNGGKNRRTSPPTVLPSFFPSTLPTSFPTSVPTIVPTSSPSGGPTPSPSKQPSISPRATESPTFEPLPDRDVTPKPVAMETDAPTASPVEFVTIPLLDFHVSVKTALSSSMIDFDVVIEDYLHRTMWFDELDSVSLVQSAMREENETYVLAYWGRATFSASTNLEQRTVWEEQEAVLMDRIALQQAVDEAGLRVTIENVNLLNDDMSGAAALEEAKPRGSVTRRPAGVAAALMFAAAIFAVMAAFVIRYRLTNRKQRAPRQVVNQVDNVPEPKDFDQSYPSNFQTTGNVVMKVPDAAID